MTQYVGCDQAQGLLDGLIDDELSMNEQLAVESHLRWCRTCALRVEDMRLIGSSLRMGSAANGPDGRRDLAVAAINDAVLMRVRAERDQSFAVRLRELFVDRRLLWPAMGATAAVLLCVGVASSVLHASAAERPDSLAAMIDALGNPGSERNPLRPADNGVSIPRMPGLDEGGAMEFEEAMPEEDGVYLVRTVVDRDGRVANYEVLLDGGSRTAPVRPERPGHDQAVRDVIRETRFTPAQTPLGQAVAVDVVWMIAKTTAVVLPTMKVEVSVTERRQRDDPKPAVQEPPATPGHSSTNQRLSRYRRTLTTA
jgi:hypothetical protein